MKIKNTRNKIERMLELPIEVTTNIPKITITGFDQIMIENYMGIIEYEEYLVKINTSIGIIIMEGNKMNLNQINENDILISGEISKLYLESTEEE
ncbi:MAG: YabP/YqfC family sporulation protein [Clostridia bacterium]|jgi:sporulation protein yqfC|nr:YabP/YqfC family sporulation protein [Clostridium sp.]MEE0128049.1 YabP/YqfC family sporulation protein [Clostridia bacterium]HJJ12289.1 YabP/YqfC family sporulation protein [Clostridiaceae bacterium]